MINWKYVAPRVLLLAAIGIALWLALDPLLRLGLSSVGSRLLGAKVEIGGTHSSIAQAKVRLENVQIANPNAPLTNLVEAREAALELDTTALLKRQFVVREGKLSGLKFNGERQTSGAVPERQLPGVNIEVDQQRLAKLAGSWLKASADALRQDLEQDLESVRLAKELMQRWPAEYEQVAARADELQRQIKDLKKLIENPDHGGVKSLDAYRRAASEMDAVREEISALRDKLQQLPRQAQTDTQSLVAAERRDLARLKEKLWLNNLDAPTLSQYLLGPEQGKQVDELLAMVKWARQFMPAQTEPVDPQRERGLTIRFPGANRTPDFLIRSLKIDGETRLGNELVRFEGEAAGITSQPAIYGHPATLALRSLGQTPVSINAAFDRSGAAPHDSLKIICPKLPQPRRVLGNPEQLAVAVSPGIAQLRVELDLRGDKLTGLVTMTQEPLELTPTLATNYGGERLARGLATALQDTRRLDATLDLSGTLERPKWKLSSNLGPQLATGIQGVFQREVDAGRAELAQQVEQYIDGQLTRLDRLVEAKEQEVLAKLNLGDQDLAQLSRQLASRAGLPDKFVPSKLVPPKLPSVDIFRR